MRSNDIVNNMNKPTLASSTKFKHTVLFVNIIDKVFIMPNIEHTNDSSIPSLLDINIKTHL